MIIDYHKLRRECQKYHEEIRKQKEENFSLVDGLYLDGRKDATQVLLQDPNGKLYQSVQLEEHYTLVGEPGTYYLTHLSPENVTGQTIAEEVFMSIKDTELGEKIKIVGNDVAASMTGNFNGFIQNLKELLNKPLQWVICLLHTNELPLRHIFIHLDGTTNSPATFKGPIGKKLSGVASDWPIAQFKSIPNPHFLEVPPQVLDDLSRDQYYSYRICKAVMAGSVESDLQYLEIGPIVHSKLLTLGYGILRLCVSLDDPPSALMFLAEHCVRVYFPTWFDIKRNNKLTYGSKNVFNLVQRITQLSNKVKHVALQNVQKMRFLHIPQMFY